MGLEAIQAFIPAMITVAKSASAMFGAMGQWNSGNSLVTASKRKQQAAEFEASQLQTNAGQVMAASERDAFWRGKEGDYALSTLIARAAASGASATDPTILNLAAQLNAKRAYNMAAEIYGGQEAARKMEMQAEAKRYQADVGVADAQKARGSYRLAAGASLFSGGASLLEKYGANRPDGEIAAPSAYDSGMGQMDRGAYSPDPWGGV